MASSNDAPTSAPADCCSGTRSASLWGGFLAVMGVAWLLGELGVWRFDWSLVGPFAIIVVGVSMMWSRRHSHPDHA